MFCSVLFLQLSKHLLDRRAKSGPRCRADGAASVSKGTILYTVYSGKQADYPPSTLWGEVWA